MAEALIALVPWSDSVGHPSARGCNPGSGSQRSGGSLPATARVGDLVLGGCGKAAGALLEGWRCYVGRWPVGWSIARCSRIWLRWASVRRGCGSGPMGLSVGRWITAAGCWPLTLAVTVRRRCGPWWLDDGTARGPPSVDGVVRSESLACYDGRRASGSLWWMTPGDAQV